MAWSEHEVNRGGAPVRIRGAVHQQEVATGAIEQGGHNGGGGRRAVGGEDPLVVDSAGDLHSSQVGYLAKNLVEA